MGRIYLLMIVAFMQLNLVAQETASPRATSVTDCGAVQSGNSECSRAEDIVTLSARTPVTLRLAHTLRSKDYKDLAVTHRVEMEIVDDVVIGDQVVIAAGERAWARIEPVPAQRFFKPGAVTIVPEVTHDIAGGEVALTGSANYQGADVYLNPDAFSIAAFVAIGAFVKGDNPTVRKGELVTGSVRDDVSYDRRRLAKIEVPAPGSPELRHARQRGRGLIYVYRNCDVVGMCGRVKGAVDQDPPVRLPLDEAVQFEVEPGRHLLRINGHDQVSVDVPVGSIQYVEVKRRVLKHRFEATVVTEDAAAGVVRSRESLLVIDGVVVNGPDSLTELP